MKITENFTYEEFWNNSGVAKRLQINNEPNAEVKENIVRLANTLQIVRDTYKKPIIINSGYRCSKLNKAVGGASNSDHLFGAAADIRSVSDKPSDNKELFEIIVKLVNDGKIKCRQIIWEYGKKSSGPNWIHISMNHKYNSQKNNQIVYIGTV